MGRILFRTSPLMTTTTRTYIVESQTSQKSAIFHFHTYKAPDSITCRFDRLKKQNSNCHLKASRQVFFVSLCTHPHVVRFEYGIESNFDFRYCAVAFLSQFLKKHVHHRTNHKSSHHLYFFTISQTIFSFFTNLHQPTPNLEFTTNILRSTDHRTTNRQSQT
jgi:hypothetical protein